MKKLRPLSRLFSDENDFTRPFFIFLTAVMIGLYVWSLNDSPALDSAWEIALFTTLMALHIGLYWLAPLVFAHPRWLAPYLAVQGALALSMGWLVRVVWITYGLYPGLIGLVIGMPIRRIWRILAVVANVGLSLINYIFINGSEGALWWVMGTIPVVIFVMIYVLLYLRQAEARAQAQSLLQELETANRQLRESAARVEDLTIAAERQRMARELHDTLSQGLAGLILQLEAVDAHLAQEKVDRARTIVRETMERARHTLTEARRAIDDLRAPQAPGLGEAVRAEAERFTAATGIPCALTLELTAAVPEACAEVAIRVVSEGLSNVARHARAGSASLRIANVMKTNTLEIEIADDGVGFDAQAVEAGHYGLLGMRERVRLAGGGFEIDTAPGRGTRLTVRIPLEGKAADA